MALGIVVRRRGGGREAEPALRERLAQQLDHGAQRRVARGLADRGLAHHDPAQGRVSDEEARVHGEPAVEARQILAEARPIPRHAGFEALERHALDARQHALHVAGGLARERCDAEAAVPAHHRRHAVEGRGAERCRPRRPARRSACECRRSRGRRSARVASSVRFAGALTRPISTMRPASMATSAVRRGAPLPSTTLPFWIRQSSIADLARRASAAAQAYSDAGRLPIADSVPARAGAAGVGSGVELVAPPAPLLDPPRGPGDDTPIARSAAVFDSAADGARHGRRAARNDMADQATPGECHHARRRELGSLRAVRPRDGVRHLPRSVSRVRGDAARGARPEDRPRQADGRGRQGARRQAARGLRRVLVRRGVGGAARRQALLVDGLQGLDRARDGPDDPGDGRARARPLPQSDPDGLPDQGAPEMGARAGPPDRARLRRRASPPAAAPTWCAS